MKAELRLGNYIQFNEYFESELLEPNEKAIDSEDMHELWSGGGLPDKKPIPLTEEWLLKIDMPEDGSTKDLVGSYDIWFERVGNELYLKTETSSKKIEFVHIAQNIAFYLTGEELGVNK